MTIFFRSASLFVVALACACGTSSEEVGASAAPGVDAGTSPPSGNADSGAGDAGGASGATTRFEANAWADNWFAAYRGDTLLKEDAVPITTERSFNAETFSFEATYPFTLAFVLKDYKENDSGLEYIGKPNQQIGDGGFVFQLRESASRRLVHVSSRAWKCLPIHRAPLNRACEKDANPLATCGFEALAEPSGWRAEAFDDRAWPSAVEFTAAAVGPKEGYTTITWDPSAAFVWSSDLLIDNTVLCRARVTAP
jgi:hypothetical protein